MKTLVIKIPFLTHFGEALWVFVLVALTVYAYHTFFSIPYWAPLDVRFYQYMLHDAIVQLENGFFPAYVVPGRKHVKPFNDWGSKVFWCLFRLRQESEDIP